MSINGLNTSQYLIDSKSAAGISESLFSALKNKSVDYSKTNLSGFTRATLGVDLYSSKTDLGIQRQVAMTSSGAFNAQMNLTSVQQLNSLAAQQLYTSKVSDAVDGKMTIGTVQPVVNSISRIEDVQNSINVFETDKDKKGSNPFTFGDFFANSENAEEKQA